MKIGSKEWSNFLIDQFKAHDIAIDNIQIRQFTTHALELVKWTRKINISTITDPVGVASKHLLDSVVPAQFITPRASLLDVGSGGGFPGIPLKVFSPRAVGHFDRCFP